ncbi:hypothetical protein PCANC_16351 [Puccinia coronata f. sp. avenae]|uniref:Ig-like domain-containing protein n=1 Tax=Puccinia coronata f. sp. avenae TaxID=200324 RepID=A0A2N5UQP5_9BASI|nr:hypothetical protein PCANC_16351 [Puccinia coronata f. sp. avenae]
MHITLSLLLLFVQLASQSIGRPRLLEIDHLYWCRSPALEPPTINKEVQKGICVAGDCEATIIQTRLGRSWGNAPGQAMKRSQPASQTPGLPPAEVVISRHGARSYRCTQPALIWVHLQGIHTYQVALKQQTKSDLVRPNDDARGYHKDQESPCCLEPGAPWNRHAASLVPYRPQDAAEVTQPQGDQTVTDSVLGLGVRQGL